ncbi:MAG: biopolymer transporter ExbD, partial [Flavobacteriaceae bacterium]|nr:biopolymer transporter ExbD [Flavobacteriaceae bacterium]
MAKAKITKKATSIDMTAMCDVSFLLLTFFILTSTAKIPEPLQVQTPSSTVQTKLPDTDLATITVGEEKAFFGVIGKDVRKRTLELMGEKYGVEFSDEEKERFSLIDAFGVPIDQLRGLIELNSSDRNKEGLQNGIPKDSLNNQLKDWVYNARVANIEKNKKELQFAIKGDAKEEYPTIKEIMDILQ